MNNFWNIDAGQLGVILSVIGGIFVIMRRLDRYAMEHELLIDDYCERKGIEKIDLITRQKTGIIFRS